LATVGRRDYAAGKPVLRPAGRSRSAGGRLVRVQWSAGPGPGQL